MVKAVSPKRLFRGKRGLSISHEFSNMNQHTPPPGKTDAVVTDGVEPVPWPRPDRRQAWPMSFGQQRMWLLQQTLPAPATYHQPVVYRLRGCVDTERLRQSLEIIVQRQEVLRTTLVEEEGELLQRISPASEIPLPWGEVDLRAVPEDQREAVVEERLAEEVRRPFDLSQAPLWRASWLSLAADDHVLLLNFHHSLIDVWSLCLFFKEWSQLYAAGARAESAPPSSGCPSARPDRRGRRSEHAGARVLPQTNGLVPA